MKRLSLSREIFNRADILMAKRKFVHLCKVDVAENNLHWDCVITDCKYDEQETMQEFENYIIVLMNSGDRDVG